MLSYSSRLRPNFKRNRNVNFQERIEAYQAIKL